MSACQLALGRRGSSKTKPRAKNQCLTRKTWKYFQWRNSHVTCRPNEWTDAEDGKLMWINLNVFTMFKRRKRIMLSWWSKIGVLTVHAFGNYLATWLMRANIFKTCLRPFWAQPIRHIGLSMAVCRCQLWWCVWHPTSCIVLCILAVCCLAYTWDIYGSIARV